MALETVGVPVMIVTSHEFRLTKTCDRFRAAMAFLGEQLTVAVGAVRFLFVRSELLSGQHLRTLTARETFFVPWSFLEGHSSFTNDLVALCATLSEVLGEAKFAVDFSLACIETVVRDQLMTFAALEARVVPFLALEFVLFHA